MPETSGAERWTDLREQPRAMLRERPISECYRSLPSERPSQARHEAIIGHLVIGHLIYAQHQGHAALRRFLSAISAMSFFRPGHGPNSYYLFYYPLLR